VAKKRKGGPPQHSPANRYEGEAWHNGENPHNRFVERAPLFRDSGNDRKRKQTTLGKVPGTGHPNRGGGGEAPTWGGGHHTILFVHTAGGRLGQQRKRKKGKGGGERNRHMSGGLNPVKVFVGKGLRGRKKRGGGGGKQPDQTGEMRQIFDAGSYRAEPK